MQSFAEVLVNAAGHLKLARFRALIREMCEAILEEIGGGETMSEGERIEKLMRGEVEVGGRRAHV
jgi:hypothetical protein